MNTLRSYVKHIPPIRLLWCLIGIFSVYFIFVSSVRHDNFHSRRLDMGNMEQTVWNLAHGNGFTMTDPMGTKNISRLAVHADYLLMFMVPFYRLWPDAKMFLFVQTMVICFGALPLFWIARDHLKSDRTALLFAGAYLLYPPLERIMLHDFHAVALSTTFLLFAYWYMVKERYWLFAVFAVLSALGKEHIWIAVGLMGIYIALHNRKVVLGSLTAGIGFFIFYYLFWIAIPSVTDGHGHFALAYLSEFGDSQSSVFSGLLSRPVTILSVMFKPDRLVYYFRLLMPLGFLPVLSPFTLLFAVHSLVINALSSNGLMRGIDYQYNSDIIPFLFIASVYGFGTLKKMFPDTRIAQRLLCVSVFAAAVMWGEIPLMREDRFFYFIWPLPEKSLMHKVELAVGSDYTVSVSNNIGSHFAKRKFLYNFPINATSADYTIVRLDDQYAWPSGDEQERVVRDLLMRPDYEVIARKGEFYAFRKK